MSNTLKVEENVLWKGTWRGHEFMPTQEWHNHSFPDYLAAIREQNPHFDRTPEVAKAERKAIRLLRDFRLTRAQEMELLKFGGDVKELLRITRDKFGRVPMLRKALIDLRSARFRAVWNLFQNGALGFKTDIAFDHTNKVLNNYLSVIQLLMLNTDTADDTLEIKTVEVGADYTAPAATDTALGNIIGSGKAPSESDTTGFQTTWFTQFGLTDNNGATTTVASITSTTVFDVASATGLAIGDRIEVQTSDSNQKRTISNLAGTTVTVDSALVGLANSDPVIQIWGESGLKGNDAGTTLMTRSRFGNGGYTKTSSKAIIVESALTGRSV